MGSSIKENDTMDRRIRKTRAALKGALANLMLVKQVKVNLLENAIRHSGNREHITLHLFRQDDWAVVEVRDRGKGLSPEICQAVQSGKPLNRDLSGDATRGMGIGLSVCQSIIKAHNGFFAAGNNPEGGAVVRFGLPMEEKSDE